MKGSLRVLPAVRRLQRDLRRQARAKPHLRFDGLFEAMCQPDVLALAHAIVSDRNGAAGSDGVTLADIEADGREEWLADLRSWLGRGGYRSSPLLRVLCTKPSGGRRTLGVPTVLDRVVQTAARLVLEPILEVDFLPSAFGYRPGRSVTRAITVVHREICAGRTSVVDADLRGYFDSVPHHELLRVLARRVADPRFLAMVKGWLAAPLRCHRRSDGRWWTEDRARDGRGIPQGMVLGPLLSNLYMHLFLRAWIDNRLDDVFDARIVNYADDFVIVSRGRGYEALAWVRRAMMRWGLELNERKTAVRDARHEVFKFLGYAFHPTAYHSGVRLIAGPSESSEQRRLASIVAAQADLQGARTHERRRAAQRRLAILAHRPRPFIGWIAENRVLASPHHITAAGSIPPRTFERFRAELVTA